MIPWDADPEMKRGTCPKCSGQNVYEIEQILAPDYTSSNMQYPVTLTSHYGTVVATGFYGDKLGRASVGVSAYVCGACAYTELYAKDLDVLAKLAEQGAGGVRKVTPAK